MLFSYGTSDQSKIFILQIEVVTRAGQKCMRKLKDPTAA